MKKAILMIFFLIALNYVLLADQLIGKITDSQTGMPIEQVSIYVSSINLSTTSNENGVYKLIFIKPAYFDITFERIGYEKQIIRLNPFDTSVVNVQLIKAPHYLMGVKVSVTKAKDRETPITFTNLDREMIRQENFGQEIPMLMEDVPGVFAYSDAGGLIGNAHFKIRGFDQKRIGVMINGIPLNDPEDHQVYFVNMPDFAESLSDIQFQRGVGSSLYGISTFGGSLNMQTISFTEQTGTELFSAVGSYNTYKAGLKSSMRFGKYSTNFRFSKISSGGYRDNSASELWAVYTNLTRLGDRSITKFNFYTGHELTHAAWEASAEGYLEENYQHNPYTYKNYVDDFSQPHFELHHSYYINDSSEISNSIFYIYGNGFYEQYKEDRNLWEHGLTIEDIGEEADIIRQKWVTKNHYGIVSQYNLEHSGGKLTAGTYLSLFDSDHRGKIIDVIGADSLGIEFSKGQKYYNYIGEKKYLTAYVNEIYHPFNKLSIMVNLYLQRIDYNFEQLESGNFKDEYLNAYQVDYNFFNPRCGFNYNINDKLNIYGNLSVSQREPTDDELYDTWDGPDDLGVSPLFATADTIYSIDGMIEKINWTDPYVKPEKVTDYEIGIGYSGGVLDAKTNLYWMNFKDEIVPYGGADDDGIPIRGNASRTVHMGMELSMDLVLPANFKLLSSLSYSKNYFADFIMYDWGNEVDFSGNAIAGFPNFISMIKLIYNNKMINLFTQVRYVGKQYLDNTENENRTIDPYKTVNAGAKLKIVKLFNASDLELNLKINNILDEEYETAGYYDTWSETSYYWPAAGRNYVVGVRLSF
ncbi:MAG: TonB-dependent receptor [Candidatus Cloacimonetes bacterium]|nr:TonB-dependent receptor [Candidatus Cloacimonadota bacterium]